MTWGTIISKQARWVYPFEIEYHRQRRPQRIDMLSGASVDHMKALRPPM